MRIINYNPYCLDFYPRSPRGERPGLTTVTDGGA